MSFVFSRINQKNRLDQRPRGIRVIVNFRFEIHLGVLDIAVVLVLVHWTAMFFLLESHFVVCVGRETI